MLLLLLKDILPKFDPKKDSILELSERLFNSQFSASSGILRFPYDEFIKLSRSEAINVFQIEKSSKYEAFLNEFNLINWELENVSLRLKDVYENNLNYLTNSSKEDFAAKDIIYLIEQYKIKAMRLMYVAHPDYSLSTGFSKKSKKKYETVKAFWIGAEGNKVRSFSKNVGIDGVDIEESVVKLFESLGYKTFQLEGSLENGYKPDLIIEKDNSKWVVEIKIKNKYEFYKTFARLEMWKLYKSIYKE
jgi:HJR/Mrr/RecB family endonuclease